MTDEDYHRRLKETQKMLYASMLSQLRAGAIGYAIGSVILLVAMIYMSVR